MAGSKSMPDILWNVISGVFVFLIVFGNYSIIDVRIIGVVLTYYRVFIPILFIFILIKYILNKDYILDKYSDKLIKYTGIVMIFWIIYGCISLLISPWSVFDTGLKEIFNICLGGMVVCISIYLYNKNKFENIILTIKIIMLIMVFIGYIEILTGLHLNTSMISSPTYIEEVETIYAGEEIPSNVFYVATGIFYNSNDYCAFLSIFAPVFLYVKNENYLSKLLSNIMLFFIFLILLIDDAWICIISLFICLMFYLIFSRAHIFAYILAIISFLFARYFGKAIIDLNNNIMYKIFGNDIFNHSITVSNIEKTLSIQVENASQQQGSLYYRINTYTEAIKEMFLHSKGLGLGAGSYQNYFADIAIKRDMVSNPHSLWIEILSQYGIIIFLLFVALMLLIIIKLFKQYLKNKSKSHVLVMSMGISFALASFAPSTFLTNSYYWIIIGIGIAMVSEYSYKLEEIG